ncbi:uncharacterized protein [Salminus brasiliensis]|uniref:uncharacterized protein n=1 Tax=Salminus brasiliensis TaxID=930266 RepID=UPI003B835BED
MENSRDGAVSGTYTRERLLELRKSAPHRTALRFPFPRRYGDRTGGAELESKQRQRGGVSSPSSPPSSWGTSDHNLVLLTPTYHPVVLRQPVTRKVIRKWSPEAEEALQVCFETTDWEVLCESAGEDIDNRTGCITDYINFCTDTIVPVRRVRCFPNNKPWITKDLKKLLNKKRHAFQSKDKEQLRSVQKELKVRLRESKEAYRRKLEGRLQQNNSKEVWTGMRQITGFKGKQQTVGGSLDKANELNVFFNRFSMTPSPSTSSGGVSPTPSPSSPPLLAHSRLPPLTPQTQTLSEESQQSPTHLEVTTGQVKRQLEKLKLGKASGPDGISTRVLKVCATQLCGILQHLFNLSLKQEKVPVLWKTLCLVPVPKKSTTSSLNDYRPVALTSHVMKVLERIMLTHLSPQVSPFLDPLQFAYQQQVGVDDAIIYLLQKVHAHLDHNNSSVRITFFDFSSAFNTIQPLMLGGKMDRMQVDRSTVAWVMDYLSDRPQYVQLGSNRSECLVSSTGAPQGTVLSPFLFTLYTTDFQYRSELCHLQKFSDYSVVVGCIRDDEDGEYRDLVNSFVVWSERNHLILNVAKTKEMVVDFRRKRTTTGPITITGQDVERVDTYKYLGVLLDSKLDWKANTEAVYRKGMSRLYFLRKLRSFNMCSNMLETFYHFTQT